MVSNKRIIVSNGRMTVDLTSPPYYVEGTKGFDKLEITVVTSQGYEQDGATVINDYILPRNMEIYGAIRAETVEEMQRLRDRIFELFVPKRNITINHYYGGVNRVITARVESTPQFENTEVSKKQQYTVCMLAADPYWKEQSDRIVSIANITGGLHFPLRIPKDKGIIFGVKSPAVIANAYNKSVVKIGMRFDFIANGTVEKPQLFNINTREFFRMDSIMEPGEVISVQTGLKKTVTRKLNGVESNYIGKIDIAGGGNTFLELNPGDNLLRYGAESGEDMLEVKIYYQNRYVGV